MAGENATTARVPAHENPWIVLGLGLAFLAGAWVTGACLEEKGGTRPLAGPRIFLLLVGTALAYFGVVRRLQRTAWDFPGRVESAAVVSISGLGMFIAFFATDPDWSSGRIFYMALFVLSLAGAILVLLPGLPRRVALSLIVLFHLAGIVTAITSVPPPNSAAPWISRQLMERVYRPYLRFLNMTNAYHFYAPDPGAPSALRIAVYYGDGKYTWHDIPSKADSPIGMDYQRMNALPEQTFQGMARLPWTEWELQYYAKFITKMPAQGSWENIRSRRLLGSAREYRPDGKPIPMVSDVAENVQYQEPTELSQKQIASVARHLFQWPAVQRPGVEVTSVKIYRVRMEPLTPYALSKGTRPNDRTRWMPFFLGEFDREGKLLHHMDPFLYWYLPILKVPKNYPHSEKWYNGVPGVRVNAEAPRNGDLLDCMEMHAATPSPEEKEDK